MAWETQIAGAQGSCHVIIFMYKTLKFHRTVELQLHHTEDISLHRSSEYQ